MWSEANYSMGLERESVLQEDGPEKETDQLHSVSLSYYDLLNLSKLVQVMNQPSHNNFEVFS